MNKINTTNDYADVIKTIELVAVMVLFDLSKQPLSQKNTILRNALSKSVVLLKDIQKLYSDGSFHNASTLYRLLLERLVHIHFLDRTNSYAEFADWSYVEKYNYRNMARGDERFLEVLNDPEFIIKKEETAKYTEIKKRNVTWIKPDMKTEMKMMGLDFLYKFGYDFSSQFVHPRNDDGLLEFHLLTKLKPDPFEGHVFNEMSNSILVTTMVFQNMMNYMEFKFIRLMYSFIDNVRKYLEQRDESYKIDFLKLAKLGENGGSFHQRP